jgi:hypothetical protein
VFAIAGGFSGAFTDVFEISDFGAPARESEFFAEG